MRSIILNADDFGLTDGTNRAIIDLAATGAISSTSLMVNLPAVNAARKLIEAAPKVGIGLHLNLTRGKPITAPHSLVNAQGEFFTLREVIHRARRGLLDRQEIEAEIRAQFECACRLVADRLDHWDSHEGIHRYEPFASIAIKIGHEMGVPAMRIHRHYFVRPGSPLIAETAGLRFGFKRLLRETYYYLLAWRAGRHFAVPHALLAKVGGTTLDVLRLLIAHGSPIDDHCWELPCHPAASTADLTPAEQEIDRVAEYNLLSSTEWRYALQSGSILLTTFGELARHR